ncbi:MAG: efflux RND transporter periplasmic adaptor subunit [Verrucomicrobiales bacterium]|nr:efflux RND transporter periplasmic adaptor subunit [Verrucomicrobiales bacterium]
MSSAVTQFSKFFVGLFIVGAGVAGSALLWVTRPIAEEKKQEQSYPVVEFQPIRYESRSFEIASQGIVEASRRSILAAEVGGKVTETAEHFDPGHRLKDGDFLLKLDPTDYLAAVAQAEATLADAEATLESEKARADQAIRDWKKMGRGGEPTDLARRGPQLRSAEAKVASSVAALVKAQKDLERTTVRAPYESVIASTSAEVGTYLSPGTPVAEIFETAPYEVRLPLSIDEVQFLKHGSDGKPTGTVKIEAKAGGQRSTWTASIIRTEGEIDRSSRSVYVVAEVKAKSDNGSATLQPGQFIKAGIPGKEIPHLAAIPFSSFLDLERISIIDDQDLLRFRTTDVVFREGETVFISGGPEEGERLCLTELSRMIQGDRVEAVPAGTLNQDSTGTINKGTKP